ncbi:MAG: hypothetical protein ABSF62_02440 [Bryobacteraceae bacterium]|jgi:hypothetical protein
MFLTIGTFQISEDAIAYAQNQPGGNLLLTLQANRSGVFSRSTPTGNLMPHTFDLSGDQAESVRRQLANDQFTSIGNYLVNQDCIIGIEPEHPEPGKATTSEFRYYLDCEACPNLTVVSATGTEARDLRARNLWMQRDGYITGGATATGGNGPTRMPASSAPSGTPTSQAANKGGVSAAARKKMALAQKKRWAQRRAGDPAQAAKTVAATG